MLQQSIPASEPHTQSFGMAPVAPPASTHIVQQLYYAATPTQPMSYYYGFQPQPMPYHYGFQPQPMPNYHGIPPQLNWNATHAPLTSALAPPLPMSQAYCNSITVKHEERALESVKPRSRKNCIDFKSQWGKRYAQLVEFKRSHGHCNVPQRWAANLELGRWVKDQRTFKRKGKISQDRIKILEDIGFQWRLKSHVDFYNNQLNSLIEYKQVHGHCNVKMSNCDNVELVRWVDRQRRLRKEGKMATKRIQQLEEVGFQFD